MLLGSLKSHQLFWHHSSENLWVHGGKRKCANHCGFYKYCGFRFAGCRSWTCKKTREELDEIVARVGDPFFVQSVRLNYEHFVAKNQ